MTQDTPHAVITLEGVHKSFGDQKVLEDVNFTIHEGTTTVITGPSGAGKSVILKHMMGLIRPDAGTVKVFGHDLSRVNRRELREIRSSFGVLFQGVALFDSMTVYDNVALPLRERRVGDKMTEGQIRQNVLEKLSLVYLDGAEDKYPSQLSGGMLKRVGLARALALNPRIIFFDEPTTGLDAKRSNEIYHLFWESQKQFNYTAVIVSHDFPRIFKLCDYVALLSERTIVSSVPPEEFQMADHPAIKAFAEMTMGPIYMSEKEETEYHEEDQS